MRGFVLSLEAVLSLLILVVFLMEFFVPVPNSASLLEFIELNDRFTASLEAGQNPPFPRYVEGMDCVSVRYVPEVHGVTLSVYPVCLR
ncbi:TPA: hypothetical protein EYP13_00030 [Candidatus Micrarchaeota archaeon]|nr:hypothetical protein [Candidatus Micrarchaeota archaeon]